MTRGTQFLSLVVPGGSTKRKGDGKQLSTGGGLWAVIKLFENINFHLPGKIGVQTQ